MKKNLLAAISIAVIAPLFFASTPASAASSYTAELVHVFNSSNDGSMSPIDIADVNGTQSLFKLGDGSLWVTDGTDAGTVNVSQAANLAGLANAYISPSLGSFESVNIDGKLYFKGEDSSNDLFVWSFDGSVFTKLNATFFNFINTLYNVDGQLYLWGRYNDNANQGFYQVDISTGEVLEIATGSECDGAINGPENAQLVNGKVIFANDPDNNCHYDLFSFDPTDPTAPAVNITGSRTNLFDSSLNNGEYIGFDRSWVVLNGELLFAGGALDGDGNSLGQELMATDGTSGGTHLVKDILVGPDSSSPADTYAMWFTRVGDKVYFSAYDGNETVLYVTDGTTEGTVQAVNPGTAIYPNGYVQGPGVEVAGKLFVTLQNDSTDQEYFVTDGTDAGTSILSDIFAGTDSSVCFYNCVQPVLFDGHVFFMAYDGTSNQVWETDGTPAGTNKVTSFGAFNAVGNQVDVALVVSGENLFFGVNDYANHGGTGEMAIYKIASLHPSTGGGTGGTKKLANTGSNGQAEGFFGLLALVAGAAVYFAGRRKQS